jgi:hypothetical protein
LSADQHAPAYASAFSISASGRWGLAQGTTPGGLVLSDDQLDTSGDALHCLAEMLKGAEGAVLKAKRADK